MIETKIKIINKLGLHARAAARFVSLASRFSSQIELGKDGHQVNGKSIMGVMMLAASQGTEVLITASGEDEQAATEALVGLINDRFQEAE